MIQPEYIQQQIDQRVRDWQHAIDFAIETLEEAKANFKIEIDTINRSHNDFESSPVTTKKIKKSNKNLITADPTVAQYA